jgi:large subunit ribosomal protein L18
MNTIHKAKLLQKRRWRIRKKVTGTAIRPRLSVKFSSKNIYAQAVNDDLGTTIVFLSSLDAELRKQKARRGRKAKEKMLREKRTVGERKMLRKSVGLE